MPNEEYALVIDYLPQGRSTGYKAEPIAQVLGTAYFTLLEVVPKAQLKVGDKIYVGKEERDKIDYIKRRVKFKELTSTAVAELEKAIERVILEDGKRFLDFYNSSASITIRMHQLELLPGLGKKHMQDILNEREKKPFESFEEIERRVHLMPNPVKLIIKRVMEELQEEDLKHYLFARPPVKQEFPRRFRREEH